jgi:molybdate/tungstate transport system substrate-binding protein
MAFALTGIWLNNPNIFGHMFGGQFAYPFTLQDNNGVTVIHVPEIVQTYSGSHIIIRGSSIELIALLESGDLDYVFEYDSVIRQHGFKLVDLPDQVNLGVSSENDFYQSVRVEMDYQRFSTVQPVFNGEQIRYGITIPASAPNPKLAAEFIAFVLGPKGQEIMANNYQPLLDPLIVDGAVHLPELLKPFATP